MTDDDLTERFLLPFDDARISAVGQGTDNHNRGNATPFGRYVEESEPVYTHLMES